MIHYDLGSWHIGFIWRWRGSVMLRASRFAIPSAILAGIVRNMYETEPEELEKIGISSYWGSSQAWSLLSLALGLLLATRVNRAMYRFWEGLTLVHKMSGEWYDATSSLIAFSQSSTDEQKANEFRHTLVRLVSLMHGSGLYQIKHKSNENFEVLGVADLDAESQEYLQHCKEFDINRVEVILHWLQELVNANIGSVLLTPPPIISRVYQELSRGMVHLNDARKITETPFPFPLAQLCVVLLMFYTLLIPVMVAMFMESRAWSSVLTYFCTASMWTLNMTAGELEQPFGDDSNDLPLNELQAKLNRSLLVLLDARVQRVPGLRSVEREANPARKNFGKVMSRLMSQDWEADDAGRHSVDGKPMGHVDSSVSWLKQSSERSIKEKVMQGIFGGSKRSSGATSVDSRGARLDSFAGVGNELLNRGSSQQKLNRQESVLSTWSQWPGAGPVEEEAEEDEQDTDCGINGRSEPVQNGHHCEPDADDYPQVLEGGEILDEWLPVSAPRLSVGGGRRLSPSAIVEPSEAAPSRSNVVENGGQHMADANSTSKGQRQLSFSSDLLVVPSPEEDHH